VCGSNLDVEILEVFAEFLKAVATPEFALGLIGFETWKDAFFLSHLRLKENCALLTPDTVVSVEVLRYRSFRSERHSRRALFLVIRFLCHPERSEGSRARKRASISTGLYVMQTFPSGISSNPV
jgi:hypothetical protein